MYRLKHDIYEGYDQNIRPVKDYRSVTKVTIGFTLAQVLSFDDETETITVRGWPRFVSFYSFVLITIPVELIFISYIEMEG